MRAVAALVVAAALVLCASPVAGQEPSSTTTTVGVPTRDIIPKPGEGEAPDDAGDRGGALQLTVLALVVIGVGAAVLTVVRQSQRARGAR